MRIQEGFWPEMSEMTVFDTILRGPNARFEGQFSVRAKSTLIQGTSEKRTPGAEIGSQK